MEQNTKVAEAVATCRVDSTPNVNKQAKQAIAVSDCVTEKRNSAECWANKVSVMSACPFQKRSCSAAPRGGLAIVAIDSRIETSIRVPQGTSIRRFRENILRACKSLGNNPPSAKDFSERFRRYFQMRRKGNIPRG
jgi:hypothetical protein